MLYLAFGAGLIGGALAYLALAYAMKLLNNKWSNPIIDPRGLPVPRMPKNKRTPRANTDLMAYQREIEEEGRNRG